MPLRLITLCCIPLALLLAAGQAIAAPAPSPVHVDVPYAGVYHPIDAHGFQLYLPDSWIVDASIPSHLHMGPADAPQALVLSIIENSGHTMDSLLAEFEGNAAYHDVAPVLFGEAPFVWYASGQDDLFGGATLSTDGRFLYFFTFTPYTDEDLRATALSILSTIAPAQQALR